MLGRVNASALVVLGAVVALGVAPLLHAQGGKLSHELPESDWYTALQDDYQVTPDGRFVLFRAELHDALIRELYVAPRDGRHDAQVLHPELAGVTVHSFALTPDGEHVVYAADPDRVGVTELWAIRLAGGPPWRLSDGVHGELDVRGRILVTRDSTQVVYKVGNFYADLFVVPLDGHEPPRELHGDLLYGVFYDSYVLTPDSTHVVFRTGFSYVPYRLYSSPLDGSQLETLLCEPGHQVQGFNVGQDSNTVLFVVGLRQVWAASIDDGKRKRLNDNEQEVVEITSPYDDSRSSLHITPDGRWAFFLATTEIWGTTKYLFRARANGAGNTRRFGFETEESGASFRFFSPDSSLVYFDHIGKRWARPPDRLAPAFEWPGAPLAPAADGEHIWYIEDGNLGLARPDGTEKEVVVEGIGSDIRFSDDGESVTFFKSSGSFDGQELFLARLDGSFGPAPTGFSRDEMDEYVVSSNARTVVYKTGDHLYGGPTDASVPITRYTSDPVKVRRGKAEPFVLTAGHAVYAVGRGVYTAEGRGVYMAALDRSEPPRELLPETTGHAVSPDGLLVAVQARGSLVENAFHSAEVLVFPVDGREAAIQVSPDPILSYGHPYFLPPRFLPDGSRVVFVGPYEVQNRFDLHSAPVDREEESVRLNTGPSVGLEIVDFELSPDGRRVVFLTEAGGYRERALFSAPVDGSAPEVRISGEAEPGGDIDLVEITPDSRRVLYVTNAREVRRYELYSASIEGGDPVRLSEFQETWVSGSVAFEVTPDGTRVVFIVFEGPTSRLYSAPVDGSEPAVQLSTSGDGYVAEFTLSPDGRTVLYEGVGEETSRLQAVPVDGSSGAKVLLETVSFEDEIYSDFAVSPDGRRAVYRYDDDLEDDRSMLYSVPLDASAEPTLLSSPDGPGNVEESFSFSEDGELVLYMDEVSEDTYRELLAVPVDGSAPPVILNPPLAPGGSVSKILPSPAGDRIVFTARIDSPEFFEIYSLTLDTPLGTAKHSLPLPPRGSIDVGDPLDETVAISEDGRYLVYRANTDSFAEELWVVPFAPSLFGISSRKGPRQGGNTVRLRGAAFSGVTRVFFGDVESPRVTFLDSNNLLAVVPPASGHHLRVDVRVEDAGLSDVSAGAYQYGP